MHGLERVTVVMTLMEQLRAVMAEENTLVRQMKLDRLNELHAEKAALADAYELELRRLRSQPELMADLPNDVRQHLEEITRSFQDASKANANILMAARTMVERMMRKLGDSMSATSPAPGYGQVYGNHSSGHSSNSTAKTGKVISVAFNREL